jgi:hypothetical protein
VQFATERLELRDKLFKILDITEGRMEFCLNDLNKDKDRQTQILDLEADIRKYCVCGHWTYFALPDRNSYFVLMRYLIKDLGYTMTMLYTMDSKTKKIRKTTIEITENA